MKPIWRAGFTLLEVMVALAVASIAISALVGSITASVRTVDALRERTLAQWVAENQLAMLQANHTSAFKVEGKTEMAGLQWRWKILTSATQDAELQQLHILVNNEQDETVASLVSYLRKR